MKEQECLRNARSFHSCLCSFSTLPHVVVTYRCQCWAVNGFHQRQTQTTSSQCSCRNPFKMFSHISDIFSATERTFQRSPSWWTGVFHFCLSSPLVLYNRTHLHKTQFSSASLSEVRIWLSWLGQQNLTKSTDFGGLFFLGGGWRPERPGVRKLSYGSTLSKPGRVRVRFDSRVWTTGCTVSVDCADNLRLWNPMLWWDRQKCVLACLVKNPGLVFCESGHTQKL